MVVFAGDANEIDLACTELARLIDAFGPVAVKAPARNELALISGDRRMVALVKAHITALKQGSLPTDGE